LHLRLLATGTNEVMQPNVDGETANSMLDEEAAGNNSVHEDSAFPASAEECTRRIPSNLPFVTPSTASATPRIGSDEGLLPTAEGLACK